MTIAMAGSPPILPETFAALIDYAGISLPAEFRHPSWDPVPVLLDWNRRFGPRDEEGASHWDGNVLYAPGGSVNITVLLAEYEKGADQAVVRVWDSGVVSLEFQYQGTVIPIASVKCGDELVGMLRVLRVLPA